MPSKTCNRSENDSLAMNSWRAPEGNPPQIQLVSNAVLTGKRLAAEMLGEYLIPPVVKFNVSVRESDNEIVPSEDVDDYCLVPSPSIRGKVFQLCEVSYEGQRRDLDQV
jgi:hypothetical protein